MDVHRKSPPNEMKDESSSSVDESSSTKSNRDEVERKKEEVKDKWHTMTRGKKLKWWSEVLELLKGEMDIEEYWFPIDKLGRKFDQRWEDSKVAQRRRFNGWRSNIGTHHTKEDAVVFALDRCMQAYKEGHIVYFFKFTCKYTCLYCFHSSPNETVLTHFYYFIGCQWTIIQRIIMKSSLAQTGRKSMSE